MEPLLLGEEIRQANTFDSVILPPLADARREREDPEHRGAHHRREPGDEAVDSLRGTIEEAADREVDPLRILPVIVEHPVPDNPLGVKGAGEAGIVGAPAAVANAGRRALPARANEPLILPLTPRRVSELQTSPLSSPPDEEQASQRLAT